VESLIGFSRMALGVHYLTDFLGGWSAGVTWLITCIILLETSFYPSQNLSQLSSKTMQN
jgi:membrane-associated phospholipid phosphatase